MVLNAKSEIKALFALMEGQECQRGVDSIKERVSFLAQPVRNAIDILRRDLGMVFSCVEEKHKMQMTENSAQQVGNPVILIREEMNTFYQGRCPAGRQQRWYNEWLAREAYLILVTEDEIQIKAEGELGFVYGLLEISRRFLGFSPFWFWMDQQPVRREQLVIPEQCILAEQPVVRFRGWFFNDEVLMLKWKLNCQDEKGWKMAFEALLRCGGNMTIPGTDKTAARNRKLAATYGLWVTHHHAEPLGAEMFVRAYPDTEPNFLCEKERFLKLWEDAVREQKDYKVVWNLCFRGQGDAPFWDYDTTGMFVTPESRGRMISEVIRQQCRIVKKYCENPIFVTNLYGEIMELYEQGLLDLDDSIIKVRADNGYGRMVARRRGNHDSRVSSMPDRNAGGQQGIYYHVSFYDLQAANHITMFPNSISFLNQELDEVLKNGGDDFWIINCSNVRPHMYPLEAVCRKWEGRQISDQDFSRTFADTYFQHTYSIAKCYERYPQAMPSYAGHEDEHCGEQFYTENIRTFSHYLLIGTKSSVKELQWLTGDLPFAEQITKFCDCVRDKINDIEELNAFAAQIEEQLSENQELSLLQLFQATVQLHIKIHHNGIRGALVFERAWHAYQKKDYEKAFVLFGMSSQLFRQADEILRSAEYGVWKTFYQNDCFADLKFTAYMIEKVMGKVREEGDDARHNSWYRKYCYEKRDQKVFLLLVTDNHMTDWELFLVMKEKMKDMLKL